LQVNDFRRISQDLKALFLESITTWYHSFACFHYVLVDILVPNLSAIALSDAMTGLFFCFFPAVLKALFM